MRVVVFAIAVLCAACSGQKGNPLTPMDMPISIADQPHLANLGLVPVEGPVQNNDLPPQTQLKNGVLMHLAVLAPEADLPCGPGAAVPHVEWIKTDAGTEFHFTFVNTGSTGVEIGQIVFFDDSADEGSCKSFTTHPSGGYLVLKSGKWKWPAGQQNVTTVLVYRPPSCGRVQIDIAVNRELVIGQLQSSGEDCVPPPPPPPPTCETDKSLCPPPPPVCRVNCEPPPVCTENCEPPCTVDCEPPPPSCETDQSLCPPPPPVCAGPWTYNGPPTFGLPNAGDATERAYVHTNVSPLLVGPFKTDLETTSWVSNGNYPVVLVKAAQVYTLYVNVVVGQVLQSPAYNQNGKQQAISHVSVFTCPVS